jgi:uncharacterized membrane protein (DUF106 family)
MLLAQVDPGTYRQWVDELGFIQATAVVLIIVLIALVWFLLYQTNTDRKKLNEKIDKLTATKDEAMKGADDREQRITKSINDTHEKTFSEFARQGEKVTSLLTAMNILIGKKFNGGEKNDS